MKENPELFIASESLNYKSILFKKKRRRRSICHQNLILACEQTKLITGYRQVCRKITVLISQNYTLTTSKYISRKANPKSNEGPERSNIFAKNSPFICWFIWSIIWLPKSFQLVEIWTKVKMLTSAKIRLSFYLTLATYLIYSGVIAGLKTAHRKLLQIKL